MDLNEELWREHQYAVLVSFIHHVAYWRCSSTALAGAGRQSELWVRTTDAHLLRAIIDWCMVFGADSNQVHWKNVVLAKPARDEFRKYLLDTLSMTGDEWKVYWSGMTTFRNDFVAHRVRSSRYPTIPKMEPALQAAIAFDCWLRQALSSLFVPVFDEPPLSDRYERLMRTSAVSMARMIAAAPTVADEYEGSPPREP